VSHRIRDINVMTTCTDITSQPLKPTLLRVNMREISVGQVELVDRRHFRLPLHGRQYPTIVVVELLLKRPSRNMDLPLMSNQPLIKVLRYLRIMAIMSNLRRFITQTPRRRSDHRKTSLPCRVTMLPPILLQTNLQNVVNGSRIITAANPRDLPIRELILLVPRNVVPPKNIKNVVRHPRIVVSHPFLLSLDLPSLVLAPRNHRMFLPFLPSVIHPAENHAGQKWKSTHQGRNLNDVLLHVTRNLRKCTLKRINDPKLSPQRV
jgi:hypothetical protein